MTWYKVARVSVARTAARNCTQCSNLWCTHLVQTSAFFQGKWWTPDGGGHILLLLYIQEVDYCKQSKALWVLNCLHYDTTYGKQYPLAAMQHMVSNTHLLLCLSKNLTDLHILIEGESKPKYLKEFPSPVRIGLSWEVWWQSWVS